MGKMLTLKASDGHSFSAYEATPKEKIRGGLVVVQEIFGVNAHIRRVADGFAADGYRVIAPAIFDRAERDVDLGYEPHERDKGMALRKAIPLEKNLIDIAAAMEVLKVDGRVGVIGYCLGGSLAWLAAARLPGLSAAVGYYGGMIAAHHDELPRCPVMLHFGEDDAGIPMADVEKVRAAADPGSVQIFIYKGAGHAFNREGNSAWHGESARVARERTIAFLRENLG